MTIYHGSTVIVDNPKIIIGNRKLDFGEGFYATYNREQAIRWSERVAQRNNTKTCVISEYEFNQDEAEKKLKIINFDKPDGKWLNFISENRNGKKITTPYDIAIGPVANDIVYTAVSLYEQGILDEDETIKRLKVQKLYNQILFHTKESLEFCQYKNHMIIGG